MKAFNSTLSAPKKPMRRSAFKPPSLPLRKEERNKPNNKPTSAPKRTKSKMRVWSTATADTYFSRYIRARDEFCQYCGNRPSCDNSHFWGRGHSATRFDIENCIGLCRPCHDELEHLKNYEYKELMLERLGNERYEALEKRARSFKKRSEAVAECKVFLKQAVQ